ncbi:MAG TPA: YceI family protein [Bacteroidia bacterium]|nr:YceI family protein [Bacteroidia bacterium]
MRGNEELNCTNCTPENFDANNVAAGVWYFDKAHGNVTWETPYRVLGSPLTGRFDYFYLTSLTFSEQNPSSFAFEGGVRLNTVNTGEPGRDDGCLLTTYGTDAAKTTEPENIASLVSVPGSGRYSTTDAGYLVDADLTFLGVTKTVVVKLMYYKQTDQGTYDMAGLSAEFTMLAKTDFGVVSSNIDDKVLIKVNANLKNKKS